MKRGDCELRSKPKNKKALRNRRRRERRKQNEEIREVVYDKPLEWNPQFTRKVVEAIQRRRHNLLKRYGYKPPSE